MGFGTTTWFAEEPNRATTSSRCVAVGQITASKRSARRNHRVQSVFMGASGV